jgi:hypothetical protein
VRRKLSIVLAAILSVAVVATIIVSRHVENSSRRTQVFGVIAPDAQSFFHNALTNAEFARHGLVVDEDVRGRDFTSTASGNSQVRLSTPLVVSAPTALLPALERAGVVRNQRFHLARYMALARRQQAPALIAPPSIDSTSGALFAAIAGAAANGARMPATVAGVDHVVNSVSPLFRVAAGPLHVDTRAALLAATRPNSTLLALDPSVAEVHEFVSRSASGDRVLQLIATDPALRTLAAQHGFEVGGTAVNPNILDAFRTRIGATLRAAM